MITIAQWLQQSPLPRHEARALISHITGLSHAQIITQSEHPLRAEHYAVLNELQKKRAAGQPLAYLLGAREFWGRNFVVSSAVLIPRPETEHLIEAILQRLPPHGRLWDLGTGSGIIAITVALERPDAQVRASDFSPEALHIAQENAQRHHATIEWAMGSWYQAQPLPQVRYHILASNPPYIHASDPHLKQGDLIHEPRHALTDYADGLSHIRHLSQQAPDYLEAGGYLMLEHGYDQGSAVRAILASQQFQHIQTLSDLAGLERITLGQWQGEAAD